MNDKIRTAVIFTGIKVGQLLSLSILIYILYLIGYIITPIIPTTSVVANPLALICFGALSSIILVVVWAVLFVVCIFITDYIKASWTYAEQINERLRAKNERD